MRIPAKINRTWHITQINICGNPNKVERRRGTQDRALRPQLLRAVKKKESQKRRLRRTDLRSREMEGNGRRI